MRVVEPLASIPEFHLAAPKLMKCFFLSVARVSCSIPAVFLPIRSWFGCVRFAPFTALGSLAVLQRLRT